jgi:hypothetical protein
MLLGDTIHFAGIILTFVGTVLLALFGSSFKVEDGHFYVNPKLASVATKVQLPGLWTFAVGVILLLWYEIHQLQIG